ncbi:MAG: hypothetical protein FWD76_01060 [Firmicutes bacterium]|nr:hypothetical protein [Bacillota bacterium]
MSGFGTLEVARCIESSVMRRVGFWYQRAVVWQVKSLTQTMGYRESPKETVIEQTRLHTGMQSVNER